MAIIKDIAGIAKGMSITFREMFKPTVVENYPDGKGPLKGAVFQERFRGVHVLQRDENGLEKAYRTFAVEAENVTADYQPRTVNVDGWAATQAAWRTLYPLVVLLRCFLHGWINIRDRSKNLKGTFKTIGDITNGNGFEVATFNATNLVYRKEQMLATKPAHQGDNAVFNIAEQVSTT